MAQLIIEQPLTSNGYTLSTASDRLGWLTPGDPSSPITVLREQYEAQGYLWLKNFLDRDKVLAFRRRYFEALAHTGLIASGTDPGEGIYSGGPVDQQAVSQVMHQTVRWAAYESFCLAEPIWQFYEAFLGGPVYLHKRKIIRHTTTDDTTSTGAHYDLTYLRGGTDRVCTSWIPLGDIPVTMGGLIYLEGSDRWGREMEAEFRLKNADLEPEERISAYNRNMAATGWLTKDLPSLADRLNTRWLIADYEAGDMMIHSAYMIHAATTNTSPERRMRLSTDIRYQLVSDEIDRRWSDHWSADDKL